MHQRRVRHGAHRRHRRRGDHLGGGQVLVPRVGRAERLDGGAQRGGVHRQRVGFARKLGDVAANFQGLRRFARRERRRALDPRHALPQNLAQRRAPPARRRRARRRPDCVSASALRSRSAEFTVAYTNASPRDALSASPPAERA